MCDNIEKNQKVLDVGCATGYLGAYLKNNFDVDIVGIDYKEYHIEKAKKLKVYSHLINVDLNSFKSELDNYTSYFDTIILCDVLEHLNDPMAVLRKLSKFLKSHGKFLIDIPNIAHSSIKYNLLRNNFNYTPMGLLDETHIHFFTPNSIINELSRNQFLVEKIEYIFLGSGLSNEQNVDYAKYPQEIIDYIENDFASAIYQIFIAFKKSNLDLESLIKHNFSFKELNDDLISKKEKFNPQNINNPLKTIEDRIKLKEEKISFLKQDINEYKQIISNLNTIIENNSDSINNLNLVISQIKNSRSWKITKPLRDLTLFFTKLKNR
ncbi:MAG: class I SAM-dependent methyltransferase [Methanobacterium sp.]|nr:class I SAM-dependent methyltransferase [Methanobacterium sp.]